MNETRDNQQEQTLEDKWHHGRGVGINGSFSVNRRVVFIAACLLALFFCWSPNATMQLFVGLPALLVAVVLVFFTLKDPECPVNFLGELDADDDDAAERNENLLNTFSLMRCDKAISISGSGGNGALYDKFIDVLIKGGLIDKDTRPEELKLKVVSANPPTYEIEMYQIGKTERQLVAACENALLAYSAYLCDVHEIGDTNYRITYLLESEIDTLASMGIITYDELLEKVEAEGA